MKAITAVCSTGASVPAIASGRVQRNRDNGENAEIQMYLSKLKDLVPFMPKNRKLSKLEVIQHVIDYICDLQNALETNPSANNNAAFDAAAVLAGHANHHSHPTHLAERQPLGLRPNPNTILTNTNSSSSAAVLLQSQQQQQQNSNSDLNTSAETLC